MVFDKMVELGSVRQTLLWFRQQNVRIPVLPRDPSEPPIVWKLPVYRNVWAILTNPIYAGAYAFGRREVRTKIVEGRARKSKGHLKPRSTWTVLIPNHHPGYVSWEQYERNQAMLAANTHMKSEGNVKAGRGGRALLSGMLRCRRCGRMLHVSYTGKDRIVPRYDCNDAHLHLGEPRCLSFGGLWVDEAVTKEVSCDRGKCGGSCRRGSGADGAAAAGTAQVARTGTGAGSLRSALGRSTLRSGRPRAEIGGRGVGGSMELCFTENAGARR
ncbi:MAG: hypothetical protein DMG57_42225 [Acidobacteria bacterium]|nr:MAG: hypothetical protein DMG57_42225 [Acidobacteriota bacterium]